MNTKYVWNCDCDKDKIVEYCWEADHNFSWDQKKVNDRECRLIPWKIKETIHSLKNPNHINKFPALFLKYGFLTYGSSKLLTYLTSINQRNLCKLITFASVKLYCLITLIYLITLISHIVQLLIGNFYFFRPDPHISFKYSRHNHLRCPMIGEVSLETWPH